MYVRPSVCPTAYLQMIDFSRVQTARSSWVWLILIRSIALVSKDGGGIKGILDPKLTGPINTCPSEF